ncbi:MAG: hypothetical protein IKF38_04100 [Clostridia bacterium]|nr:hypothetical protein [Clostridia bacterium]
MKRERVTDFGELIKSFWKPLQENLNYEDGGKQDIVLEDIDAKIFKEAFKNVESLESNLVKEPKEDKERKRANKAQVNMASKQAQIQRTIQNQQYNEQNKGLERED